MAEDKQALLRQYLRFTTSIDDLTGSRCWDCKMRVPSESRLEHAREHLGLLLPGLENEGGKP